MPKKPKDAPAGLVDDQDAELATRTDDGAEGDGTSPTIARLEKSLDAAEFDDPFFARGDLRDLMLRLVRELPNLWHKLSEAEQRDLIASIDNASTTIVQKIARGVAAEGRKEVVGFTLESLNIKDGLKAVLKGPYSHEAMVILGDAQGKQILVSIPDAGKFDNQRSDAKPDPDQPAMFPDDNSDLANASDRMKVTRDENGRLTSIVFGTRKVQREGDADGDGQLTVVDAESGEPLGEPTADERAQFDFAADNPGLTEAVAGPAEIVPADDYDGLATRVNLKTGTFQVLPEGMDPGNDLDWTDERDATPEELASAREAQADFDDGDLASQKDA